jgi:hypothetical protein
MFEKDKLLTIHVPVVFMARYVMVLRGATSLRGALEGEGPENLDFFGPWNGTSEAKQVPFGPKKVEIFRAQICKRLRSPGIDSKESIPPAYVASGPVWQTG